ncbi:MAG TPA: GTP-binding protein [Gemmatimonadaceae bacterium]
MPTADSRERMSIVIAGHVDHGKSTIIGRLLADSHSLPDGKLEQVRTLCARTGRPFEYAFLLDALKDEQAQGITIDAARVFFKTPKRDYLIIDAPGHVEFLKNMVTGASRAEAALLVIDAKEGVQENSRRHGYMLSMLGIDQCAVLVNKMDLVGCQQGIFDDIVLEYGEFLDQVGIRPSCFIPVSGRDGDNIARRSSMMSWYCGSTVLGALDEFQPGPPPVDQPFRMSVQGVYKFTGQNDDRRIVAGTVETGRLQVGDDVVFYPSGKKSRVRSIEAFRRPPQAEASAGMATGFTLEEQIYVARGEMATRASEPAPKVTTRLRVNLFWLARSPLVMKKEYTLKLGAARVPMRLESIVRVMDASTLSATEEQSCVQRHDVAECVLKLNRAIAFDLSEEIAATSRFVVVDEYEIRGGGIVREALTDKQSWVRQKVQLRNSKWERGVIAAERRAERYSQRAMLLLITGEPETDRKGIAKEVEALLFADGKLVYFLGIGNVLYGVDADIERKHENRMEHMRRLAEVANIMLDAGVILIVSAAELTSEDLAIISEAVDPGHIETIWVGDRVTTDLAYDFHIPDAAPEANAPARIKEHLQERGIIFRPW